MATSYGSQVSERLHESERDWTSTTRKARVHTAMRAPGRPCDALRLGILRPPPGWLSASKARWESEQRLCWLEPQRRFPLVSVARRRRVVLEQNVTSGRVVRVHHPPPSASVRLPCRTVCSLTYHTHKTSMLVSSLVPRASTRSRPRRELRLSQRRCCDR